MSEDRDQTPDRGPGQGSEVPALAEYRRRDFVAFRWDGEENEFVKKLGPPHKGQAVPTWGAKGLSCPECGLSHFDHGYSKCTMWCPGNMVVIDSGAKLHRYTVGEFDLLFVLVEPVESRPEEVHVPFEYTAIAGQRLAMELKAINRNSEPRDSSYLADNALARFLCDVGLGDVAEAYRALKGMEG